MSLDPDFVDDCFYGPDALLIDEIVEVDREAGLVRARMPAVEGLPLIRDQRGDPRRHPRHVAAGLIVHATGIIGFAHAYYVLGLRHREGWVGFGTHIHTARFRALATIGPPLFATCRQVDLRRIAGNVFVRYAYRFEQESQLVYESEQSAVWRPGPMTV